MKKIIAMILVIALTAAISVGATMAYLTDTDEDVNVMTVGNVRIEQNEQQRVEANGEFTSALEPFEQGKLLMPVTYPGNRTADTVKVGEHEIVLSDNEANYVDKIISVTNTGKSAAFVRTLVAVPTGGEDWEPTPVSANNCWLHWNIPNEYADYWTLNAANPPMINVEGVNYYVWEFVHKEALAGGETTYPSVRGFYMDEKVNNDDDGFYMTYADGTTKRIVTADTVDVLVLSQAVQAAGFADAETALDTAFGKTSEKAVEWFSGIYKTVVTPDSIDSVDFTAANKTFTLSGNFGALAISELGEGSVIDFENATVAALTIADDAVITGEAEIESVNVERNSTEPIELTLSNAALDITGALRVDNTDGKSVLNIENSTIHFGTIFVGGHTLNAPAAMAEFNVINSYISGEENSMGSTIAVWGASGVDSKIYDSEIHTYSRGWHQSEDSNDNSITFQGAGHINVDIQRSNMHLYGARSIINARPYGGDPTINFTIDESLIWVVTKSNHGENTLPVWGATEITDSALLFTKNAYNGTTTVKSFVFGNPVIHGNYAVTTQCGWATDIAVADGQTVTIAKDANVSVYDGAAEVNFVLTGSAKVVVEAGATLTNIGVKAADGYTLNTTTSNGSTVYTVTAN